jgi:hypothetical protein
VSESNKAMMQHVETTLRKAGYTVEHIEFPEDILAAVAMTFLK